MVNLTAPRALMANNWD